MEDLTLQSFAYLRTPLLLAALALVIGVVLTELEQLGARVKMKARPDVPSIWWEKEARTDSLVEGLAHVSGHPG